MSRGGRILLGLVLFALLLFPIAFLVGIGTWNFVVLKRHEEQARLVAMREAEARRMAELARSQFAEANRDARSASSSPESHPDARYREHQVELTAFFDDFPSRRALGLVVGRVPRQDHVWVIAPASLTAPASGKINGRQVTRAVSRISFQARVAPLSSAMGGMAMGGMGMPGMEGGATAGMGMGSGGMPGMGGGGMPRPHEGTIPIVPGDDPNASIAELPGLAMTLLNLRVASEPIALFGDLPEIQLGERLTMMVQGDETNWTVDSLTESLSSSGAQPTSNVLIRARGWTGDVLPGSLLFNGQGTPVAIVLETRNTPSRSDESRPATPPTVPGTPSETPSMAVPSPLPGATGPESQAYAIPLRHVFNAVAPYLNDEASVSEPADSAPSLPATGREPLDERLMELVKQWQAAGADTKDSFRQQVRELLEKQFEQRHARQQQEIDELTTRLEQLRATHAQRSLDKQKLVDEQLKELEASQPEEPPLPKLPASAQPVSQSLPCPVLFT